MRIVIDYNAMWWWAVERIDSGRCVASGTSPYYDEACECARIAWEQHSKEDV